jgi:predicted RNA methylase
MSWLLQSPPGLALILKKEMQFRGALERKQDLFIKRQRNHDLVFAQKLKSSEGLPLLRIAEAVYECPIFGRFKISKRQLETLADALGPLGPRRLVVQVAGRVFDRRDLSRWLEKEMSSRGYEFSADVEEEVWMFCIDEAYYFGIPVTKAYAVEGRDEREEERHGSLPAPIGAALAFAGLPKNDDVILDPVCGSGTLLAEALAYAPEATRIGVDIDAGAIKVAKANLGFGRGSDGATSGAGGSAAGTAGGGQLELRQGDSRKPLDRNDVSLVLANFPFGKQFGEKKENPELYHGILQSALNASIKDSSKSKWRAVLLTSDLDSLRGAIARFPELETQDLFRVKIRGELATALLAKRRGTQR